MSGAATGATSRATASRRSAHVTHDDRRSTALHDAADALTAAANDIALEDRVGVEGREHDGARAVPVHTAVDLKRTTLELGGNDPAIVLDDVVERANATHFGLAGSVWSSDPERASTIAERLECGTVWTNTHLALAPHQPFGGAKWSGVGVENGPWGLYGFTELQVLHRAR